jgi:hypothetical protein
MSEVEANAALREADSSEQESNSSAECDANVVANVGNGDSTPPRKKLKRMVRYKKDWESEFSWLNSVNGNALKGYCSVCRKEFSVGHSGKGDVVIHSERPGHKKAEKAANTRAIKTFFVRSEPRSTLDQQVNEVP